MNVIVLGSKLAMKDDTTGNNVYYATTACGKAFWANEPLKGGTIVDITERKAGTTYADKDGVEQTIKKDGFNLNIIVGNASDLRQVIEAKALLAELETV